MTPADIKALRTELKCTTRELAQAIDVDQATVLSWERGETFPTKQFVERMQAAKSRGAGAIPKRKPTASTDPMAALADPELWSLLRKLIKHPELRKAAQDLAKSFEDA